MRGITKLAGLAMVLALTVTLGACAPPPPYYHPSAGPAPEYSEPFRIGLNDKTYTLTVEDRTPFGVHQLPASNDVLYQYGYDAVRRQKQADFAVDIILSAGAQDDPNARAANTVGGALIGAAAGAIIGGAFHDPGAGAAIGAASGGALGLAAPAATPVVRIDVHLQSFNERLTSSKSRVIDLAGVPPHEVHRVIDGQIADMLRTLPRR